MYSGLAVTDMSISTDNGQLGAAPVRVPAKAAVRSAGQAEIIGE